MNSDFDARDYDRGVKRRAKDFRRSLHLALDTAHIETTKSFDEQFRSEVQAILRELSYGYESVNAIGLHRSTSKPPQQEQAFFLFHEALNLSLVALRTIRGGSVLASDSVLRQALELASVAHQIAVDNSAKMLKEFLAGRLHAPGAISGAKKIYAPIGRLYGILSNSAVHASTEHIRNSLVSNPEAGTSGRINIGASFDPSQAQRFKLGLIRIERVTVAIVALIEAGLVDYVEQPHLWKKTSSGLVEWADNAYVKERLRRADADQKAIEEPYPIVYPWADPSDKDEVKQLLGATQGDDIADVKRLSLLSRQHPESFVLHYLYGAALYDLGDFQDAASQFEDAWRLRRDGYDVWSRLEAIYRASCDLHVLEDFYRRSLANNPEDYIAVHNLGKLYERMNRPEDALDCFRRAHELKPKRYQAVYNAANALLRLGRYEQAIAAYQHASERDPDNPDPWHSTGVAYVRAGDLRAAYRSFRRAVQLDPGYVASWANLAITCRELGMLRRALCCARRAQRLAPGDERITELVRTEPR